MLLCVFPFLPLTIATDILASPSLSLSSHCCLTTTFRTTALLSPPSSCLVFSSPSHLSCPCYHPLITASLYLSRCFCLNVSPRMFSHHALLMVLLHYLLPSSLLPRFPSLLLLHPLPLNISSSFLLHYLPLAPCLYPSLSLLLHYLPQLASSLSVPLLNSSSPSPIHSQHHFFLTPASSLITTPALSTPHSCFTIFYSHSSLHHLSLLPHYLLTLAIIPPLPPPHRSTGTSTYASSRRTVSAPQQECIPGQGHRWGQTVRRVWS